MHYDEWLAMSYTERVHALDTGCIDVDMVASFPYADKSPAEIARVRVRAALSINGVPTHETGCYCADCSL